MDNSNPDAPTLKVLRATKTGSFKRQPPVFMRAGDVVEIEVGAVGTLINTVAAE